MTKQDFIKFKCPFLKIFIKLVKILKKDVYEGKKICSYRKGFSLLWSKVEMTTTAKPFFFSLPPGDPFALFVDIQSPTLLGLTNKFYFKF